MAKKKETKNAATDIPAESPVGDADTRTLHAGTTVLLPGSSTLLMLETDVHISGEGVTKDAKFVGMLARDQNNWDLNIDQVEGTWNPITCRREDEPVAAEE